MGPDNLLLAPETIERIISNPETLRSMLDLDEEIYNIVENGESLIINFVLCDVVIENVFGAGRHSNDNLENYNKITIYFKPSCELSKELSSINKQDENESILFEVMKLLNKEHKYKQELIESYKQVEKINKQLEQQLIQKAIIETKINDNTSITKVIPRKPFNKRLIFANRNALQNLQQEFKRVNDAVQRTEHSLNVMLQKRHILEVDINKNIDEILDFISENYIIEKIESLE